MNHLLAGRFFDFFGGNSRQAKRVRKQPQFILKGLGRFHQLQKFFDISRDFLDIVNAQGRGHAFG